MLNPIANKAATEIRIVRIFPRSELQISPKEIREYVEESCYDLRYIDNKDKVLYLG